MNCTRYMPVQITGLIHFTPGDVEYLILFSLFQRIGRTGIYIFFDDGGGKKQFILRIAFQFVIAVDVFTCINQYDILEAFSIQILRNFFRIFAIYIVQKQFFSDNPFASIACSNTCSLASPSRFSVSE